MSSNLQEKGLIGSLKESETLKISDLLAKIREERNQVADSFIKNKIEMNQIKNDRLSAKTFTPFTYDLQTFKQKYIKEGESYCFVRDQ